MVNVHTIRMIGMIDNFILFWWNKTKRNKQNQQFTSKWFLFVILSMFFFFSLLFRVSFIYFFFRVLHCVLNYTKYMCAPFVILLNFTAVFFASTKKKKTNICIYTYYTSSSTNNNSSSGSSNRDENSCAIEFFVSLFLLLTPWPKKLTYRTHMQMHIYTVM